LLARRLGKNLRRAPKPDSAQHVESRDDNIRTRDASFWRNLNAIGVT